MDTFFTFMEGPIGRGFRGLTLAIAGLLPVAMGLWDPCLAHLALRRLRQA